MEPSAYVIDTFSNEWIRNSVITIFFMVVYLQIGKRLDQSKRWWFAVLIPLILLTTTITGHTRNLQKWVLEYKRQSSASFV